MNQKTRNAETELNINHFFFFLSLIITGIYFVIAHSEFSEELAFPAIVIMIYAYFGFCWFIFWKYGKRYSRIRNWFLKYDNYYSYYEED